MESKSWRGAGLRADVVAGLALAAFALLTSSRHVAVGPTSALSIILEMVSVRTAALAASGETIQRQNAVLLGINRIFKATLTTATEEGLGRVRLTVAEELTTSSFGFVGEITPDGPHSIAVSDPGWEICSVSLRGDCHDLPVFKIHGIYGHVLTDGRSLIANDPASHADRIGVPEGHPPLTSFLGVPLVREDRTIGMIAGANREGGYSRREQETLEALAPVIVEAFGRKRAEQALRDLNDMLEHRVRERTAEVRAQTNRLRALAVQLSQTQQRERKHLARILHDHVQQLLSAARMQLLWLRREPATEQVVNDALGSGRDPQGSHRRRPVADRRAEPSGPARSGPRGRPALARRPDG